MPYFLAVLRSIFEGVAPEIQTSAFIGIPFLGGACGFSILERARPEVPGDAFELLRPISTETTHLVRWDRIEQPILAFVRSCFAFAGFRGLVDDWHVDGLRTRSADRTARAPQHDCTRDAQISRMSKT